MADPAPTYDWGAQLPEHEYGLPKTTNVFSAIETLIGLAHAERDADLLCTCAAAWSLLGYNLVWVSEPMSKPPGHNAPLFTIEAIRGRNRRKLRTDGLAMIRTLAALDTLDLLRAEWVSHAGSAYAGYGPFRLPKVSEVPHA